MTLHREHVFALHSFSSWIASSSSSSSSFFPSASFFVANKCIPPPSNATEPKLERRSGIVGCCYVKAPYIDCDGHGTNLNACIHKGATNRSFTTRRRMIIGTSLPFFHLLNNELHIELLETSIAKAAERKELDLEKIQEELRKVITKSKAAGILRLVFHEAGTFDLTTNSGGMNGSIVYELERPENTGLKRSVKVLEKAKSCLDPVFHVSWADLIAVAGAQAVAVCGGPAISVELGRLDSSLPDPEGQLPEETLNAIALKEIFQRKGFSAQEMIVLSGAHTLGSKGFGEPTVFDNSYYKTLLRRPWLESEENMGAMIGLPSDRVLVEDSECKKWLEIYANNQETFFKDFSAAYLKLINLGARWKVTDL
ncbi:hypothetical protein O6H91_01G100600 [Diphasiastrum complanatum]|uniref:Uncharacterized protein n=1 Tax=Diphasiastrum complanatum TaxID=34168 RepID=A0ACC2ETT7_DIPCM|nr:hypothetical protein O6H91_01G100600 [Diphasiastrum complanatum]